MHDGTSRITKTDLNYAHWLSFAVIVLLYVVIRIHIVNIPLDRDEGTYGYTGQLILDHGVPYRDVFDHKPPLVFYIYALALLFIPPTTSGIHIFLHAYNFLTLIVLFFLAKTYFRSPPAGLWTALSYALFSASPAIQGFTASTEMFTLLPVTLSILFAVLAIRKENVLFAIFSGMAGALACWIKQTAVFSVLFAAVYMAFNQVFCNMKERHNLHIHTAKLLMAWSAGALCISFIIGFYFYYKAVFQEFVYWSFVHNVLYSQDVHTNKLSEFYIQITNILKGDFFTVGVGIFCSLMSIVKKEKRGYFVLGFIFFSVLGTILGYNYPHYFAQLAPAVAVAAGFGFSNLINTIPSNTPRLVMTLCCAALIIVIPLTVHSGYYFKKSPYQISRDIFKDNPFPESIVTAEFIAQRTDPGDKVFIFGSEPQILFYSERKSATSYIMFYPLMSAFPRHQEFQKRAWEEITNSSPKYILFVTVSTSFLWDGKADLKLFQQTKQLIHRDYVLEALIFVGGESGYLLIPSQIQNIPQNTMYEKKPGIFIYRKKE